MKGMRGGLKKSKNMIKKRWLKWGIIGLLLPILREPTMLWYIWSINFSISYMFWVWLVIFFVGGSILGYIYDKLSRKSIGETTVAQVTSKRYWLKGALIFVFLYAVAIIFTSLVGINEYGGIVGWWNACGDMGCEGRAMLGFLIIGTPILFIVGSIFGLIYGGLKRLFNKQS